jgi:hypothetical protein
MDAIATVTSSSFGQPPRSCLCIGLRSTFATALAARFLGSSAGEDLTGDRMAGARRVSTEKTQTGDDATGIPETHRIHHFPSITLIEGPSTIVITLNMPSMRANGLSMMLEELEVDPDPQGMANLLAYQQTPRQVISGSSVL